MGKKASKPKSKSKKSATSKRYRVFPLSSSFGESNLPQTLYPERRYANAIAHRPGFRRYSGQRQPGYRSSVRGVYVGVNQPIRPQNPRANGIEVYRRPAHPPPIPFFNQHIQFARDMAGFAAPVARPFQPIQAAPAAPNPVAVAQHNAAGLPDNSLIAQLGGRPGGLRAADAPSGQGAAAAASSVEMRGHFVSSEPLYPSARPYSNYRRGASPYEFSSSPADMSLIRDAPLEPPLRPSENTERVMQLEQARADAPISSLHALQDKAGQQRVGRVGGKRGMKKHA